MNKHNLEAIEELFKSNPSPTTGINENFYWAVHGNWPAISEILKRHFAAKYSEKANEPVDQLPGSTPDAR